ncbi:MAG: AAA family ATPase, partial [Anaerolineae bacterium]|nr:AAA family ATPase [Anaerolineae bacterium]
ATNRLDIVDSALLRPGRFDVLIELPVPDREAREAIFKIHTKDKPLTSDVDLGILSDMTEGAVGAEIESICRQASMLAIREFLNENGDSESYEGFQISMRHFRQAMDDWQRLRPREEVVV